jgi:membrane protein DedA with SNARE-associated domain
VLSSRDVLARGAPVPDLTELFQHIGYGAIFVVVLLGNAGVPAPEESVLVLGGYLASQGRLHLPLVILVGIASASFGDNLGFWAGHHYGRRLLDRLPLSAERKAKYEQTMVRHSAWAVFVARFIPGLRTVAGPLAGIVGMPHMRFFIANLLGAIVYVPCAVLAGYGIGYGLGEHIEKLRKLAGGFERVAVMAVLIALVLVWIRWQRRAGRPRAAG